MAREGSSGELGASRGITVSLQLRPWVRQQSG
jgi:hypothetical protein